MKVDDPCYDSVSFSLAIVDVMSFPIECVGSVCDAFLLRTKDLLIALEQNPSNHGLATRAHFSILTLDLMIQKNCDAVLYICKTLRKPENSFFKVTFKFLLSSKYFSVPCIGLFQFIGVHPHRGVVLIKS